MVERAISGEQLHMCVRIQRCAQCIVFNIYIHSHLTPRLLIWCQKWDKNHPRELPIFDPGQPVLIQLQQTKPWTDCGNIIGIGQNCQEHVMECKPNGERYVRNDHVRKDHVRKDHVGKDHVGKDHVGKDHVGKGRVRKDHNFLKPSANPPAQLSDLRRSTRQILKPTRFED